MDTTLSILNVLGDISGPAALVLAAILSALHLKNGAHITDLFNKFANVSRDVAVVVQTVKLNHAALPLAIASGVAQIAQDTGVPDKIVQQAQSGAGTAAALAPVLDTVLQVEAPTVEAHLHTVLTQLGTAALALSQAADRMQAPAAPAAPAAGAGG